MGMDGRKDPGRVAEVIRELGADIVGLGEALSHLAPPRTARGSRAEEHDQNGALPCDRKNPYTLSAKQGRCMGYKDPRAKAT
jgi:endonuclease/exonuclease/phosphatase family metal-dependent hydrolase